MLTPSALAGEHHIDTGKSCLVYKLMVDFAVLNDSVTCEVQFAPEGPQQNP